MKVYLFDVDGVLCDTGCTINQEFHDWFVDWSKDKIYCLVTGGERSSTMQQVGDTIINNAYMNFHCMGNHIFIEDREYKINQFDFNSPERYWLECYVKESPYHTKVGNHIEVRTGSVNFSVLGRDATLEQKKEYADWDIINKERLMLIKEFTNTFPKYEAYIGGNASIDICLRDANKSKCIDLMLIMNRHYIFFGDKCFTHGIDYPLYSSPSVQSKHWIKNGYHETWEKLKTI
jgi:phosphomannomutase